MASLHYCKRLSSTSRIYQCKSLSTCHVQIQNKGDVPEERWSVHLRHLKLPIIWPKSRVTAKSSSGFSIWEQQHFPGVDTLFSVLKYVLNMDKYAKRKSKCRISEYIHHSFGFPILAYFVANPLLIVDLLKFGCKLTTDHFVYKATSKRSGKFETKCLFWCKHFLKSTVFSKYALLWTFWKSFYGV